MAGPGEFDDFEDDGPDDSEAIEAYLEELKEAIDAFGVVVPGGQS